MFSMKPRIFFQTVEQTTGGGADSGEEDDGVAFEAYTEGPPEEIEAEQNAKETVAKETKTSPSEESVPEGELGISEPDDPSQAQQGEDDTSDEDPFVEAARSLGWSEDEIAETQAAGPTVFRRFVTQDVRDAQARQMQEQYAQQMQQPQQPQGQTQGQEKKQDDKQQAAPSEFQVSLDPEEYGEEVVNAFNQMKDYFEQRVQSLQNHVLAQQQLEIQRQEQEIANQIDSGFAELPEEWQSLFGNGNINTVTDQEFENRNQVYEVANTLYLNHINRGQKAPSWKRLVATAAEIAFPNKKSELTRKDIGNQLKGRRTIQRPTQRKTNNKSPKEAAMETVQRHLQGTQTMEEPGVFPD